MKDKDTVHFLSSEEAFDKARELFLKHKIVLEQKLPHADIQHVGSLSVPGAIGKFDIDIQVRVSASDFFNTIEVMRSTYKEKHPELWVSEFAIFESDDMDPIDYMVTVVDSDYDDFYRVRDYLLSHPEVLEEYNDLKRKFEGKYYSEYRQAKNEFLGGNGKVRFLEY